jgi:hypothetical protein
MGAQLVSRAYAFAVEQELSGNEMRLLTWMALKALDADKPPRYFAAREESAVGLGRRVPDEPAPDDPDHGAIMQVREAAFQRVKIATQGLIKAGAIERTRRGREGQRAEFVLSFGIPRRASSGTDSVPLEGTESVPLSGSDSVPTGVRNPYPQGTTEEPQGEDGEDMGRETRPPHVPPPRNSDTRTHHHHLEEVA